MRCDFDSIEEVHAYWDRRAVVEMYVALALSAASTLLSALAFLR